ncbi:pyruvate dehydrogenase E3 component [Spiroplasma sabaudiense Ar-1343]|uniref:Dihydrolipoyl dehydrogenase n=1 Tax=Spiroplasma sabaudiense Ar-1343 TaxID=1276257 RepID=W6A940_9MOLU|nr:dihydrolipoyl dehydrogenase [Spiroplasma sabaudiense]AHI53658.1 pyruvate dehydrogenase E3 component [Spiroplasma sabaudiense Ar-1343]
MKEYDLAIIGAGPGGYVAAIKAAQHGLKTLIIEKEYYGGVCLNVGCIPTKALLKSTSVYNTMKNAEKYGILVDKDSVKPDWNAMIKRKEAVIKQLVTGVEMLIKKNKVDRIDGSADVVDNTSLKVNGETIKFKNLIIASGSVANELTLPGFEKAKKAGTLITSTEALSLKEIPKSIVIIGGGVIGIEFSSLFRRLGTQVTILQGLDTILEILDKDISKEMTRKLLTRPNVKIETSVKILRIENNKIYYNDKSGKECFTEFDYVLQSVGRRPNLINFGNAPIKLTERNAIQIDDFCRTSVPNIYAIGDVTGKIMLAHVASNQAEVAIENIVGNQTKMNYSYMPSCIYTSPEVAVVGLTEEQVIDLKIPYKAFKFPLAANGKSIADGNTDGFVKVICDPKYGQILGAHIIASTATDMISEITTLMVSEGTIAELAKSVHPHPTVSEAIMEVAIALQDKPLHL